MSKLIKKKTSQKEQNKPKNSCWHHYIGSKFSRWSWSYFEGWSTLQYQSHTDCPKFLPRQQWLPRVLQKTNPTSADVPPRRPRTSNYLLALDSKISSSAPKQELRYLTSVWDCLSEQFSSYGNSGWPQWNIAMAVRMKKSTQQVTEYLKLTWAQGPTLLLGLWWYCPQEKLLRCTPTAKPVLQRVRTTKKMPILAQTQSTPYSHPMLNNLEDNADPYGRQTRSMLRYAGVFA